MKIPKRLKESLPKKGQTGASAGPELIAGAGPSAQTAKDGVPSARRPDTGCARRRRALKKRRRMRSPHRCGAGKQTCLDAGAYGAVFSETVVIGMRDDKSAGEKHCKGQDPGKDRRAAAYDFTHIVLSFLKNENHFRFRIAFPARFVKGAAEDCFGCGAGRGNLKKSRRAAPTFFILFLGVRGERLNMVYIKTR